MAYAILCTMRDEAPFLLEWLAYHRAIGFEKFVIYSNDCTDGTDTILAKLNDANIITHVPHSPLPSDSVARAVASDARSRRAFDEGDWVIWLDADEFLNIHVGDGHMSDLVGRLEDADGICLSWRLFGDSGQASVADGFVSSAFSRCASPGNGWKNVKTLFRQSADVQSYFQHRPIMSPDFWRRGGHFLSGRGLPLDRSGRLFRLWQQGERRGKIDEQDAGWDWAQINHYAVRTPEHYKAKQGRGRIGRPNQDGTQRYDEDYYDRLNANEDSDESILRWREKTLLGIRELNDILEKREPESMDTARYQKMHQAHLDEAEQRSYSNKALARAIKEKVAPANVVDVGCGVGYLISELQGLGIDPVGVEGLWLEDDATHADPGLYVRRDLEEPLALDRRFDLSISIEVAEHLEVSRAEGFVADLCRLSDAVVFSAAIPGQGGKGHKNEQWQGYWAELFAEKGYSAYDVFRPAFLKDPDILPWFRQNVLLFLCEGHPLAKTFDEDQILPEMCNMILPEYHRKVLRRTRRRLKRAIEDARSKSLETS